MFESLSLADLLAAAEGLKNDIARSVRLKSVENTNRYRKILKDIQKEIARRNG